MTKEEKNARTLHLAQQALNFAYSATLDAGGHMGHTTTDVEDSPKYKELLRDVYSVAEEIAALLIRIRKVKDKADGY